MSENKTTKISKAQIIEEIADFWDTHSLADFREETKEAKFEIRAKRRRRIPIDFQHFLCKAQKASYN